ncbi:MAG: flagellar basal body-associated FliL family protein [Eubacteriales bacterium]
MAEENIEVQEVQKKPLNLGMIKIIVAGVAVIILAAGMSFAVAMFAAKTFSKSEPAKGDGFGKVKSESIGTTFDAGEFITNLSSEGGNRFIKVKIVFAFPDPKVQEEIVNKLPEIQHTVNSTLRRQSAESLSEPKAMEKLSDLLKKNVNALLVNGNVTNVYFTSFVVQ